jgi:hypothetical protein
VDDRTAPETGFGTETEPAPALVISLAAPRPKPKWIEPLGVGALLVGGAALLCASAPLLCRLVVPLGLLGLILGAAGLVRVLMLGRTRLVFPVAGISVAVVLLGMAWLFPAFLGPTFLASRAKDAVDPTAIRAVPRSGKPTDAENPEWADASRLALQKGGTNVQVLSASVRRVGPKSPSANKLPPGDYQFIRLRTQLTDPASGSFLEKVTPRLTDTTGKDYRLCDIQEIAAQPNERRSSVFPVELQDQVLVFEAPAHPEDLRLELPAEAWGAKGAYRFSIPVAMIHDERPATSTSGGRR